MLASTSHAVDALKAVEGTSSAIKSGDSIEVENFDPLKHSALPEDHLPPKGSSRTTLQELLRQKSNPETTLDPHVQAEGTSPFVAPKTSDQVAHPSSTPSAEAENAFAPKAQSPSENELLNQPNGRPNFFRYNFNRAATTVKEFASSFPARLTKMVERLKQRWGAKWNEAVARLKRKFGRGPPELPLGADAQLAKLDTAAPWERKFEIHVTAERGVPTDGEKTRFNFVKMDIGTAFDRSKMGIKATPYEALAEKDVEEAMEALTPAKQANFEPEFQAAAKRIKRSGFQFRASPKDYFPDLVIEGSRAIDFKKFTAARAIQMNPKKPVIANQVFSTAEEVMHTLPEDFDLTTELYRYSLIQGFEKLLVDVRKTVQEPLQATAEEHMADVFANPSLLKTDINLYVSRIRETDFEQLTGESPSAIFQDLKQGYQRQKIVDSLREKLLNSKEFNDLKAASRNRETFQDTLLPILREASDAADNQGKVKYLKELQDLSKNDAANHPFVEELFQRKLIGESTREKLNPKTGMNHKEFLEALGTQEEFTKTLMSDFKQDILARTRITDRIYKNDEAGHDVERAAISRLAKSYGEELDKKAKPFYLTREAFEDSGAIKFKEAIDVYQPHVVFETFSKPDRLALTKSYIRAHYGTDDWGIVTRQSQIEKFFNEINIPSVAMEGDVRLKGTPWEQMPARSREKVNEAATLVFKDFDGLKSKTEELHGILELKLEKLERQLDDKIPVMLQVMEQIAKNAIPKGPRILSEAEEAARAAKVKLVNAAYAGRLPELQKSELPRATPGLAVAAKAT
ncbi:hypothetical protein PtB15_15B236 [Puccinia triticina]|nr:hypothetical protein PtB15_15B236 [Puccinia triticina]